jgi:hypothetical protein
MHGACLELPVPQAEGPSEEEAAALLTLEQRARETALQENGYWHDKALTCYKSRLFQGVRTRPAALLLHT